jgi:hypothetical protein
MKYYVLKYSGWALVFTGGAFYANMMPILGIGTTLIGFMIITVIECGEN